MQLKMKWQNYFPTILVYEFSVCFFFKHLVPDIEIHRPFPSIKFLFYIITILYLSSSSSSYIILLVDEFMISSVFWILIFQQAADQQCCMFSSSCAQQHIMWSEVNLWSVCWRVMRVCICWLWLNCIGSFTC